MKENQFSLLNVRGGRMNKKIIITLLFLTTFSEFRSGMKTGFSTIGDALGKLQEVPHKKAATGLFLK